MAVYTKVRRGWKMPRVHRRRRAMYEELCGRIDFLLDSDPSLDIQAAVLRAVHSPASSFFLSPSMIGHILNRALAHEL